MPTIPPLSSPLPAPAKVKEQALAGVVTVRVPLRASICPATVFSMTPAPPVVPLAIESERFEEPPEVPVNCSVPAAAEF